MGNFKDLPSDIKIDILSRLPAESLLDCKLVSKPWRNFIRHPSFSKIHLNHLNKSGNSSFIFLSRKLTREPHEFYYSQYDENRHESPFHKNTRLNLCPPFAYYAFAGSCDDLLYFNASGRDEISGLNHESVYICNPITREYVILPTKGYYFWTGFGYVPSTNEYKVVRIHHESGGDSNVKIVQVYTLRSGSGWRDVGMIDINMKHANYVAGAFANGALHWMDPKGTIIHAFHLNDENFSELPSPPPCLTRADVPYLSIQLGVLGDFLSATFYYDAGSCDIWLLKKNEDDNGLSWSEEFSFDCHIPDPFEFTKSGRLLCHVYGTIYSCYLEASSATMDDVSFGKFIDQVIPHKNTFVSLKALGEKDTKTME